MDNIHPIFDKILKKEDKESLLNQTGIVIWMVGLSGSGKSTIAKSVEAELHSLGFLTQLLDGDNLRAGINNNLGFSEADRLENIRRAAEVAKIFLNCGVITICSFISPTEEIRAIAKNIVGSEHYFEVYINAPFEVCEKRDVKGLYKKARAGEIKGFTGLDSPFEAPKNPSIELKTDVFSLEQCKDFLVEALLPKIE
ncbi:MAG: adenylyl-sulfate kinase [Bacteroidetes bacterium]|nr:MAG: adenylyl-sulfate kinase [Bacteroidota bacterium]